MEPLLPAVGGMRVVDLACGTGRWLQRLISRGPRKVVGLDLSLGMLRRANDLVPLHGQVACADCESIPLQDRSGDVVLCSLALDHIPELERFASEASRITAAGGILVLSEFHPEAHERGWKRAFRSGADNFELAVTPRPLSRVHEAFEAAGFELETCEEPAFGEPERVMFARCGREHAFESARDAGPALFVARYRKRLPVRISGGAETLRLTGARVSAGPDKASERTVETHGEKIVALREKTSLLDIDLTGYLLLPGLINAHDHLEFSLYPRLARRRYANAPEWANDIYRPDESPVREHRAVPKDVRLWWGGLKNLLAGVTTVSHHNPYMPEVFQDPRFPVRVVANFGWAHSFALESDVAGRFRDTPAGAPFLIHLGEGIESAAAAEFSRLEEIGAARAPTVVVHALALTEEEHERLQRHGGAIVWCPSSNLSMFGETLDLSTIEGCSRIAMGSDSPISGGGDLLDEFAVARQYGATLRRIYEMVTALGANVLHEGGGSLVPGAQADFVAVRDRGDSPAESLARMTHDDIELVIVGGRVRMISPELRKRWRGALPGSLERIVIDGVERYVDAPVTKLLEAARRHLGTEIKLAGKRVWQ
jgi:cytosine/adenosine deaminase-related metal-dependent hydrolase/ubiquinone/menaquinone biosynthesis C-methylase UbiE